MPKSRKDVKSLENIITKKLKEVGHAIDYENIKMYHY